MRSHRNEKLHMTREEPPLAATRGSPHAATKSQPNQKIKQINIVKVLVAQSCLTLCDPIHCSLPGSPLSVEFSRKEDWSRLPFPSPGDLPNPGIKPRSPALKADSLPSKLPGIFPNEYSNKQNPKCLFFQEVSQNGSATLGIPRVFPAVCVTSNCV